LAVNRSTRTETRTRRAVDSCAQQNFKPSLVVPAANIDATVLKDPAFEGAVGVNNSPLWFGSSAVTSDFAAAYKKEFPNDVLVGYSTLGWQAGVVIGTALKSAPDVITSQTILDSLYAMPPKSTFGGWTAPVTYPPGKPAVTTPCQWYVQIKGTQLTAPKGYNAICAS
jgi:branched-chain amino acid transport system substrate-binding protein